MKNKGRSAEAAEKETYIRGILQLIGDDPAREGLKDTPKRVAKSWDKLFGGYKVKDPEKILRPIFHEKYDEVVLLSFELFSTCEHHMLPFFGTCHIGYIPNGKIVGVSKLARLAECFARRLQIQERMTTQIAETIHSVLEPLGTGVIIVAQHFCMTARGVEKQNSKMKTSSMHGVFREMNNPARHELLELIK